MRASGRIINPASAEPWVFSMILCTPQVRSCAVHITSGVALVLLVMVVEAHMVQTGSIHGISRLFLCMHASIAIYLFFVHVNTTPVCAYACPSCAPMCTFAHPQPLAWHWCAYLTPGSTEYNICADHCLARTKATMHMCTYVYSTSKAGTPRSVARTAHPCHR